MRKKSCKSNSLFFLLFSFLWHIPLFPLNTFFFHACPSELEEETVIESDEGKEGIVFILNSFGGQTVTVGHSLCWSLLAQITCLYVIRRSEEQPFFHRILLPSISPIFVGHGNWSVSKYMWAGWCLSWASLISEFVAVRIGFIFLGMICQRQNFLTSTNQYFYFMMSFPDVDALSMCFSLS